MADSRTTDSRTSSRAVSFLEWLSLGGLLGLLLCRLYIFAFRPTRVWIDLLVDDAYYYLGIARNLALGRGSIFLPPFATNGYHPLWMILLAISARIFGTSDKGLAVQCCVLSFLLTFLFVLVAKRVHGSMLPALFCAWIFIPVMLWGMETALIPVLFLLFMESADWRKRGLLGSALFLARLDALSLVLARDLYAYFFKKEDLEFRQYFILVPAVVLYAALNWHFFGIPLPVSGLSKSVGQIPGENFLNCLGYWQTLRLALLFLAAIEVFSVLDKTAPDFRHTRELAVCTIALLACQAYYSTRSGWPLWFWYFWPSLLVTYYLCEQFFACIANHGSLRGGGWRWGHWIVVAAVLWLGWVDTHYSISVLQDTARMLRGQPMPNSFGPGNVELAEYIHSHANFPAGSYFAKGDRAGSFGFLLGDRYRFFQAEGIVGPSDYYRAMSRDQGYAYVSSLPIDYWVADREGYLTDGEILGVAEPNLGTSSHVGPYLLCFDKNAAVWDRVDGANHSYLFDFKRKVPCPAGMQDQFLKLRAKPNGVAGISTLNERQPENVPRGLGKPMAAGQSK